MNRRLPILAIAMLSLVALVSVVLTAPAPVLAQEGTQISGLGEVDDGECGTAAPFGQEADFSNKLSGDLTGCLYVFVDTFECGPGGTYVETGTETFVGDYLDEEGNVVDSGTFWTTYVFIAKFESCTDGVLEGQISGGCYHPIIPGSGTEGFKGVSGRLVFIDDIEAGNFPYEGNLAFPADVMEEEGAADNQD